MCGSRWTSADAAGMACAWRSRPGISGGRRMAPWLSSGALRTPVTSRRSRRRSWSVLRRRSACPATDIPMRTLPVFSLSSEEYASNPELVLARLRADREIALSERGYEILTYALCSSLARDRRLYADHMALVREV